MDYGALKVADLKNLLKERGIPSTGLSRKQQIVEALEAHDAEGGGQHQGEQTGEEGGSGPEVEDDEVRAQSGTGEDSETAENGAAGTENDGHDKGRDGSESAAVAPQPSDDTHIPDAPAAEEPSTSQPTVLESNQPVSKEPSALTTPRPTSPLGDSASSDRKRKRRSPTPPVDEETVNKKLKAADGGVIEVGEDAVSETKMEDAPPAVQDEKSGKVEAPDASMQMDEAGDSSDDVEKSLHPPTRAIYISNLVRPIQHGQLSEHLTNLAQADLDTLHLGSIRTHAFAVFDSSQTSIRVRSRLHGQVWPDEPARKALWVDFVPEDKVREWIDRETEGGRRDTRRWEVVYDETDDGVVARHQEGGSAPAPDRRPSNMSASGAGMPDAPLGPRGSRASIPPSPAPPASAPKQEQASSASFTLLDEKFPSTTARPKLYFSPIGPELAARRIDELERQTSREWGARGADLAAMGDVRRYTFEDGDRIVDGGPHYDDFSGPRGGGGMGRRRGGGRGGRR